MIRDHLFWITLTILALAMASTTYSYHDGQYMLAIFAATLIGGSVQSLMQMYHQARIRKESLINHERFKQSLMDKYNEDVKDTD